MRVINGIITASAKVVECSMNTLFIAPLEAPKGSSTTQLCDFESAHSSSYSVDQLIMHYLTASVVGYHTTQTICVCFVQRQHNMKSCSAVHHLLRSHVECVRQPKQGQVFKQSPQPRGVRSNLLVQIHKLLFRRRQENSSTQENENEMTPPPSSHPEHRAGIMTTPQGPFSPV